VPKISPPPGFNPIRICKTVIFPVVFVGVEGINKLQDFEKKMLRKMAGPTKTMGYCVTRNFVICTGNLVFLDQRNSECIQNFGGETTWQIKMKIRG
jgi:hypothetical protein